MEAPVASTWTLDGRALPSFVAEARDFLAASGPPALVGLADPDPGVQRAAIYDTFALGRRDPRPLLLLRAALRYLSEQEPLRLAIGVLTLCVGHGDIFWTPMNWIEPRIADRVRESFDWSYDELCRLLAAAEPEEYERGSLGQNVHALVSSSDSARVARLEDVVLKAPKASAWPALMVLVHDTGERALPLYDRLVPRSAALHDDPAVAELRTVLVDHGSVSMY
ncbi:MAG: hypothetical protein ACRDJ3_05775 [Solirubrobacteraceae bacterium]